MAAADVHIGQIAITATTSLANNENNKDKNL